MKAHAREFSVRRICSVLGVHFSGFYAWLKKPRSDRTLNDLRQTALLAEAWRGSGKVYGYRKLHADLREASEAISLNRAERLARLAGIKAQIGYKHRLGKYGGKVAIVVANQLDRQFAPNHPDQAWVTDITYIKTYEVWGYLYVVIDLFSRRIVGWSFGSRMTTDLALQALIMTVWRRKPKERVLIHSDQGSQFTSLEWKQFLMSHNLEASMSRRGTCHDNAVAESFFQLLKRERVKRRIYATRQEARQDIFDYIELFYNPVRNHTNNGLLSPIKFEDKFKIHGV